MERMRNRYLFLTDIILCFFAYAVVIVLAFPVARFSEHFWGGFTTISVTAAIYVIVMLVFRIYSTNWIYAGVDDYICLLLACFVSAFIGVMSETVLANEHIYPKINLSANFIFSAFLCGSRFALRAVYSILFFRKKGKNRRTLIIGAGSLAISLVRNIHNSAKLEYNVIGLIDDDVEKHGTKIHGVRVLGGRDDIVRICSEYMIDEIIFAINSVSSLDRSKILDICAQTDKKVRILPSTENVLNNTNEVARIREIDIEDLLDRDPIVLDNNLIQQDICGKTILVTGGGGSIGSELCRQILRYHPRQLVIFDIYENTTYEVQNELKGLFPCEAVDVLIGSVRDKKRLEEVFRKYRPDMVFHAAAHKHVPLMEDSPCEAIKNNVFGTYNTAICANKYGAETFVLISTDKAVNPTNVMGASKRMCEMIVQTLQKTCQTTFVAVRFGNVLGSHGSVIPLFKKQIADGGPVTVTHPEITRFFMTIPEAAQLVLQAASYAKGGEIFILDMGKPVKIYDLARKMISISGFVPDRDIKIEFTGLRAGEKLYEELLMSEEGLKKTAHSKIFVGSPIDLTVDELNEKLDELRSAVEGDENDVRRIISEVVPTYSYMKERETVGVK